ncbi:F-box family protein [Dorcoceras hygrometricum]|uniref:F-box family protein n=1 Tax=Dorcoceras hygrometricum TaxID=472368 RepID=A0A2Z7A5M7_9LAMI|nr:F-box family protein [Dorcoceras hygrometricum]
MSCSHEMSLGSENFFDRLPDEILHSVFIRLRDAKFLCVSMAVCRRFRSIVPQVDEIFLRVPRKNPVTHDHENGSWSRVLSKNLLVRTLIFKPMRFISGLMRLKGKNEECSCDGCSYHTPNEILKPFEEIRSLHVRIPSYGDKNMGSKAGREGKQAANLLKWKAEFGSQMQSCVILGAKSCLEIKKTGESTLCDQTVREADLIADAELKLRIVWTISCLIAASARHELIREIVKDQRNIENVVISDESGQGKVCMNRGQIEEMRNSKKKGDDQVHSLSMKMWYVEKLEVPSLGKVMEGATVVAIRPSGSSGYGGMEELVAAAFGGDGEGMVVGEAVGRLMAASRCYTLEISSF